MMALRKIFAGLGLAALLAVTGTADAYTTLADRLITVQPPVGAHLYDTPGTYTWVAPLGVYSVDVVAIGPGGYGGTGGSLSWKNNVPVVPGNSYTVVVAAAGTTNSSYFNNTSTVSASNPFGSARVGDGGGNGGAASNNDGAGGAGGYTGNGGVTPYDDGTGSIPSQNGGSGTGGGAGAGAYYDDGANRAFGGGGGTGVYGSGSNGAGGVFAWPTVGGGGAGSGGTPGTAGTPYIGGSGGCYGGSAGGGNSLGASSCGGAVRIVWGLSRAFPSTNVAQNLGGIVEPRNDATWSPTDKSSNITLSNGNTTALNNAGTAGGVRAESWSRPAGKYYFEVVLSASNSSVQIGLANKAIVFSNALGSSSNGAGNAVGYNPSNGQIQTSGATLSTIQTSAGGNNVEVAVDFGAALIWIRTNGGNWNNSGTANPATDTGGVSISGLTAPPYYVAMTTSTGGVGATINVGGSAFAYAVPAGFTPGFY